MMLIGTMWGSFLRHQRLGLVTGGHDYLRKAREYGFECYQLSVGRELASLDEKDVRATKAVLDELGMACSLAGPVMKNLENRTGLRQIFDAARALDAIAVQCSWRLGMFARHKNKLAQAAVDAQIGADIDATQQLARLAEDYRIPVAFENHIDYRFDEIARILEAVPCPFIGLNFDSGNPLLYAEDPLDYVRAFAPRIFATHLKDWYAIPHPDGAALVMCGLGEGIVDIPAIMAALRRQAQRIALNIEYWAQAVHEIPYRTGDFWRYLGRQPADSAAVIGLIDSDAGRGHPVPLRDRDAEGLQDEIRVMKAAPGYLGALCTGE